MSNKSKENRHHFAPLLGTTQNGYRMRLKSRHCCVKSKAALLVLCWNLLQVIGLVGYILEYGSSLATVTDYFFLHNNELQALAPAFLPFYLFCISCTLWLDVCLILARCGRYKTISNSLWFISHACMTCMGFLKLVDCF